MDIGNRKQKQAFESVDSREINGDLPQLDSWEIMKTGEDLVCEASSSTFESSLESSINSIESSSSELMEDASSSSTSNSLSSSPTPLSYGPLYELSDLMANLPIKRGLSKFYEGKSQSFTSLGSAKRLEDLAKNIPQRKRMKSSKSYGGGLDAHKYSHSPKPLIAKKLSKPSNLSPLSKRNHRLLDI